MLFLNMVCLTVAIDAMRSMCKDRRLEMYILRHEALVTPL
jgi:hypothetical protein